jgi:hypothetical protein
VDTSGVDGRRGGHRDCDRRAFRGSGFSLHS